MQEREDLVMGPFESGEFIPVKLHTLHRHRVPYRIVRAGQTAAANIGRLKKDFNEKIRKGMVLVSAKENPKACFEFEADVYLLFHANQISQGFQVTVHTGNVCQTAVIATMNKTSLRTNERARVKFRFISRPEYLTIGSRLIFREGATKGLGEITTIFLIEKT